MNEHKTAGFVASLAWMVFLGMCVALFAGHAPKTGLEVFGITAVVVVAFVASIVAAFKE